MKFGEFGAFGAFSEVVEGPCCERCGGASVRAAKTRKLGNVPEAPCYLAYLWSCSVCGHGWVDEPIERLNSRAADHARARSRGGSTAGATAGAPSGGDESWVRRAS